eukprot:1459050-Alexandrium_andersonii.AAC.1
MEPAAHRSMASHAIPATPFHRNARKPPSLTCPLGWNAWSELRLRVQVGRLCQTLADFCRAGVGAAREEDKACLGHPEALAHRV